MYIPLSWISSKTFKFETKATDLSNGYKFIYSAQIDQNCGNTQLAEELIARYKRLVLRGCRQDLAKNFEQLGAHTICLGETAEINLTTHQPSKSLQKLVIRGERKNRIVEVNKNQAQGWSKQILKKSKYHNSPKLKYLFIDTPCHSQRYFLSFDKNTFATKALVSISPNGPKSWHVEQMLRCSSANVGTMEHLFEHIFTTLKDEQYQHCSLGEVPFTTFNKGSSPRHINFLAHCAALAMRRSYNFEGLYNFKNKFNPEWKEVYWCAYPKLSSRTFFEVFRKTNCMKLALSPAHPASKTNNQ